MKNLKYLIALAFFASCYDVYFWPNISIKNKTKKIVVPYNIHFEDTLAIINPFVKIYTTNRSELINYKNRPLIISGKAIPNAHFFKRFTYAEELLGGHFKRLYNQFLTSFNIKFTTAMTKQDSLLFCEQMNKIKNKLSDEPLKRLTIPDTLYNILSQYHYKQFLITDVNELYSWTAAVKDHNIYSWYRFFIFDMSTKSLVYYNYSYDCGASNCGYIDNYNDFTKYLNNRLWIKESAKKLNRQLKRAHRKERKNKI